MDEYVTVNEAAAILGVTRRTVFSYIAKGKLIGYRSGVGNVTRVKRSDLEALREIRPREKAS